MIRLILLFVLSMSATLPVIANDLIVRYESVCFDRKVDKVFCCVAQLPDERVREICVNDDFSMDGGSEGPGTIESVMETSAFPSRYPLCNTKAVHEFPDGYPCLDTEKDSLMSNGKPISLHQYFKNLTNR